MKMYEANTSEEVKNQILELESVLDNLDTAIRTLKNLDKSYFRGDISDLEEHSREIEEEIDGLEEEFQEKLQKEQKEYENELQAMNYEFERTKL